METAVINLLWHPQAQFAGYHIAEANDQRAQQGVCIHTTPLEFGVGPVNSVLSGESQFGVASPAHLLESDAPDDLRLLLTIQQDSPLVYPVRKSLEISTLAGLSGHKIGVWPSGEDLEFRWMLHKARVSPDKVQRVPMADTVTPFLAGEIASAQVTVYHELHQIEAGGLSRDALHLFKPSDLDAALLKDGLFTTARLVDERPEFVQAVVDAVLEGWVHAFQQPAQAVDVCVTRWPSLDSHEQVMQLEDIRALTFCNATLEQGLGYPDPEHVARAAAALMDVDEPVASTAVDCLAEPRFWDAAPAEWKPTQ